MGIELVKAVATRCGSLRGTEYKVLVLMASVALDRPNGKGQPPRLYFAGWEPLALALGQDVPPDLAEHQIRRKHQYELVRRALRGLETAGLIRRQRANPG